MARILNNEVGRRNIVLSTDDVIMIVREYQKITNGDINYEQVRSRLNQNKIYLPEDIV